MTNLFSRSSPEMVSFLGCPMDGLDPIIATWNSLSSSIRNLDANPSGTERCQDELKHSESTRRSLIIFSYTQLRMKTTRVESSTSSPRVLHLYYYLSYSYHADWFTSPRKPTPLTLQSEDALIRPAPKQENPGSRE